MAGAGKSCGWVVSGIGGCVGRSSGRSSTHKTAERYSGTSEKGCAACGGRTARVPLAVSYPFLGLAWLLKTLRALQLPLPDCRPGSRIGHVARERASVGGSSRKPQGRGDHGAQMERSNVFTKARRWKATPALLPALPSHHIRATHPLSHNTRPLKAPCTHRNATMQSAE